MDTGLHYVGFSRDQALKYFSDYAWDDTDLAKKEVRNLCMDLFFILSQNVLHFVVTLGLSNSLNDSRLDSAESTRLGKTYAR